MGKTHTMSQVHRRGLMDDVTIRRSGPDGRVVAFDRFVGLFTSKAYAEEAQHIPVLRAKLRDVLEAEHAAPGSHNYKELVTAFNSFPKEELFRAPVGELREQMRLVLDLKNAGDCAPEPAIRSGARQRRHAGGPAARALSRPRCARTSSRRSAASSGRQTGLLLPRAGRGLPGADALLLRRRAALGRGCARWRPRSRSSRARGRISCASNSSSASAKAADTSWRSDGSTLSARTTRPAPRLNSRGERYRTPEGLARRRPGLQRRVGTPGRQRQRPPAAESELRMYEVGEALRLSDVVPTLQNFGISRYLGRGPRAAHRRCSGAAVRAYVQSFRVRTPAARRWSARAAPRWWPRR